METNTTAFPLGLNMPSNYATGKKYPIGSNKLVWRPAVIGTNPSYDETIQSRSANYVINDDNVTINYTVTNNNLTATKTAKKQEAKEIGKGIILAKHDAEQQRNASLGLLTAGEITTIQNDITTIRNHYKNTVKSDINAATTVQEVKAVAINFPPI